MPPDTAIIYTNATTASGAISWRFSDNTGPMYPRHAHPCARCGKEIDHTPAERFGASYHQHCLARVVREGRFR